ncbi:hypothetical protein AM228_07965 [Planktothricoides sp. SR001]|nr:hypothetical protein AM228_07965 [Planktothricoides sp. SR001]
MTPGNPTKTYQQIAIAFLMCDRFLYGRSLFWGAIAFLGAIPSGTLRDRVFTPRQETGFLLGILELTVAPKKETRFLSPRQLF